MKTKLENWGYQYAYSRSGVEIKQVPALPAERLKEILIRELGLDVRVDSYAFACFICAYTDIGSFDSMPWALRAELLADKYGVDVSERTLRSWCSKLIQNNAVQKHGRTTYWKTEMYGSVKYRSKVAEDDAHMEEYFLRRQSLYENAFNAAKERGLSDKKASASAWSCVYAQLWEEYQCCYYSCKGHLFNALGEEYLTDIYELAQEIATVPSSPNVEKKIILTKEDFDAQWNNFAALR